MYTIIALVLLAIVCVICVVLYTKLRESRRYAADISGPLADTANALGHALSTFASGDLRYRIVPSGTQPSTEEGKALQSILFSGIGDFNSITELPSKRICFSGANSYREGAVAGQEIARILGGKGKIACIFTNYSQVNHVLRMKGCLDYLAQKHPGIKSVGAFPGTGNREVTFERYREIVSKYPDIDLIFITDGHTPFVVAEDLAKKGKKIRLVAFDAIPENVELLKAGKVSCLIEQNSYAQAWNAIVHLYNSMVSSWRPVTPKLFMEPIPVRLDNYRTYWDDAKNERIMKEEELAQLAVPMPNKTGKKLRFGMILPLSTGFFEGLGRGAKAANDALAAYGVTVEVLDVFESWDNFGSASVFTPVIERFVRERYDGFATVVNDPAIVQSINKAVESGLKVTTFNTEPSNFREIILSIINNISDLSRESLDLAASAEESSRANVQIGNAITAIRGDIRNEQERIAANDGDLAALNGKIGNMRSSLELYASRVADMSRESAEGAKSMDATLGDTQRLKGVVDSIASELGNFSERLARITQFAGVIESLAENTNVLAINASIQAARAGSAGKAFAVVAGEVRTLSANSRKTAEDIRELVAQITGSMRLLVDTSSQGSNQMTANLEKMTQAKTSFESIASVIREANEAIGSIRESVAGIVETGDGVKANMDAIERMSESSVNRLEEISSSVGELLNQSSALSSTANRLSAMTVSQEQVFAQLAVKEGA